MNLYVEALWPSYLANYTVSEDVPSTRQRIGLASELWPADLTQYFHLASKLMLSYVYK